MHASAHSRPAAMIAATPAPSPTPTPAPVRIQATPAPIAAPRPPAIPVAVVLAPEVAAIAPPAVTANASPAPAPPIEPLVPNVTVVRERVATAPAYLLPLLLAVLVGLAVLGVVLVARRRRQRRELLAVERGKLDFLLLSSHELRTPLSVASGYVALAEDGSLGELPPALEGALPTVSDKLGEVQSMLDRMLLAVQASFGRLSVRPQPVRAADVVEAAIRHAARGGHSRGRFAVSGDVELVAEADPEQAAAALGALLDNAAKFSDRTSLVRCVVRRGRFGKRVNVEVTDVGSGLSEAARVVLFARFGRRPTPSDSHLPGAGLGLYVARELARAQGGDLRLKSTSEGGSIFVLSLPAAPAPR